MQRGDGASPGRSVEHAAQAQADSAALIGATVVPVAPVWNNPATRGPGATGTTVAPISAAVSPACPRSWS